MMVPRAFTYSSIPTSTLPRAKDTSRGVSSGRRRSSAITIRGATPQEISASLDISFNTSPSKESSPQPTGTPATTVPVPIPTLTPDSARRRPSKTHRVATVIRQTAEIDASLSPKFQVKNVAELLAATKITPPKRLRVKRKRDFRSESLVEDFSRLLLDDVNTGYDGGVRGSISHGSLDILLSPPNELGIDEDDQDDDLESKGTGELANSMRSVSTESMPSLETDSESSISFGAPVTPLPGRKSIQDRRVRLLSASEECALNHPLLLEDIVNPPDKIDPSSSTAPILQPKVSIRPSPPARSASSAFKSNLTASLRALKSAAQSVSNFTSSSTPQEDFLTRSLFSFSPEMTDDRRPLPSSDLPSPALRRYLNPLPAPLVPTDLHVYHDPPVEPLKHSLPVATALGTPTKFKSAPSLRICTASIQLQTYRPSSRPRNPENPDSATAPPIFANSPESHSATLTEPSLATFPTGSPVSGQLAARQREPRENSDFLRMVVCEMEMRRKGKFRDDVPGRARVWLPPRKAGEVVKEKTQRGRDVSDGGESGEGLGSSSIPKRWIAIQAEP